VTHWFIYTRGCTPEQAKELDALAEELGMGDRAGLELFAKAHNCTIANARESMSINRASHAIKWGKEMQRTTQKRRLSYTY
jgi:transcriptional regulator GlxA family with amidase domain